MPLSYQNYTGDNATTQFSIPFTYQNTTEISVTVDGVAETGLTFPSSSTVQLTSAPASGAIVQVRRTTDLSARAVDFASGSVLTEEDLDDSAIQVFHAAQESKDVVNDTITLDTDLKWEADNKVIKNVANPVNLQDAATKNYIENTWLTTSDKAQLNSLSIPNLNSVATNITDVTTVANNISDVNAFAQVYRSGPTDPTTSLDVGDLFYNTTSNLLKIWSGSSWETGVAGASGLLPLSGGTMTGSIAFSGSQTVDGRDVSTDGAKLDLIEAAADVTDAANVNPLVDAHLNTSTAAVDQVLGWTGTDYDWVDNDSGAGDLLAANNLSDLTNTTTARTNLGVAIGSDVQAHSSVLDGTTASFTTAEESKLAGIEDGATADQTNAEIRAAVEAATDSNVFTDADHSKLNAIEANATADQTGAEIKAAYEAEANTNAFTDADHTKLNGIEAGADVTDTTNVTAAGALMDSEVDADIKTLSLPANTTISAYGATLVDDATASAARTTLGLGTAATTASTDYATAAQGTTADAALPRTGGAMTGAITTNSTFDGRNVSVDGSKLDGIEAGATADQTASEIRALVESATDSNVFTDADHTKLNGIEASADVTDVTNVTAAGALMDSEVTNLAQVKAFNSADYATAAQGTLATNALPKSGGAMTGAITTNSTFDGRDVSVDGAKLDGIEAGATADQTASEIRALVESATDSNVFTDADHTKLNNLSTTELYGENPVSATTPVAAGVNSVAIGDGASAGASSSVLDSLAIGTDAAANSSHGIAIGRNSSAGIASVAVGSKTNSAGSIGATATWHGVALGNNSYASGFGATAVGYNSYSTNGASCFGEGYASGTSSLAAAIGNNGTSYGAQGFQSVALGYLSKTTASNSISIGNRVINSTANSIAIGGDGSVSGNVETVKISGAYNLPTADGTSGQVMTTDGAGTVSFTTVSGGGGISNVVEDTTPQLGGDLDVNSKAINFGDSNGTTTNMLTFGVGDDLKIYHHATAGTYITESGTGNLNLLAGDLRLMNGAGFTTLQSQSSGIRISNSYILPTADGTSGQVMTTDGSGVVTFADAGGGASLELYAENPSTPTNPTAGGTNSVAIGNNAVVTTAGAGLNGDKSIAIGHNSSITSANAIGAGRQATVSGAYASGFGYKATSAGTESHAATNSYASGTNSFAAAIANNTNTYGALNTNSVAIGYRARSNGTKSIAIGENTNVSAGSSSVVIGAGSETTTNYAYALGYYCTSSGNNAFAAGGNTFAAKADSVAMGNRSVANVRGKFAFASGRFAADGDAQGAMYILRADTTDATPTVLTTNNSVAGNDDQIIAENDTCITFDGTITAMQNGAQAFASFRIEGLLVNDGGTTTLVNSATTIIDNQSSWGMVLSADTTNNALAITVTGEALHNIRWVANIRTSEVTYA